MSLVGGHTGTAWVGVGGNGTDQFKEEERRKFCVTCPTNALETAVRIVVHSMNIHQDDHCHSVRKYQ